MESISVIVTLFSQLDKNQRVKALNLLKEISTCPEQSQSESEQIIEVSILPKSTQSEPEQINKLAVSTELMQSEAEHYTEMDECIFCKSKSIIKYGFVKGIRRYKCKECTRSFTILSGQVTQRIKKKELFCQYKEVLSKDGLLGICKMANRLNISIQTSFDWRHKILSQLKEDPKMFKGITEMDDIWIPLNRKGRKYVSNPRTCGGRNKAGDNDNVVKLLVTKQRKAHTSMKVCCVGRLKSSDIVRVIGERCDKNTQLVSDKHPSIGKFAKTQKISHQTFLAKTHKNGEIHVETINSYAAHFKTLIDHVMRGVSTKYLQNYANWFGMKMDNQEHGSFSKTIDKKMMERNGWNIFASAENN